MTQVAAETEETSESILDPMDRIAEILFGLFMALTFTSTLGFASAGKMEVRTMMFAALGCNLAWGIIDGGIYLLQRLSQRSRAIMGWRMVRDAPDPATGQEVLADALPPLLAQIVEPAQLETLRQKLYQTPEPDYPRLTGDDWKGAFGISLLCFLSTFPIVIPFMLIGDAQHALRVSNIVAIVMLFFCGFAFGRFAGFRPFLMGAIMVVAGSLLVGLVIALGG